MVNKKERAELIDSQLEKHPEMQKAEKIIFVLLLLFVFIRLIPAVLQTVYVYSSGAMKTDCLMNYILVILSALFAVMVAQGVKFFALLGCICGGYSLVAIWLDHQFAGGVVPGTGALYNAYTISLITVCIAQILIMVYLLASKSCSEYLTLLDSVNKDYFESGDVYK